MQITLNFDLLGVGGNLVAVQASRISTSLHQIGTPGKVPPNSPQRYRGPLRTFFRGGSHSSTAKLLVMMVIPGSALFLFTIALLQAGHTTLTLLFFIGYLICALLQVRRERERERGRERGQTS